jgi:hypothetical protein
MKAFKVNTMLKGLTRSKLLQIWFIVVALVVVAGIAFGVAVTAGTAVLLLALCLVPPVILLLLWPGVRPQTVAEVLHDVDRNA